jgi:drug/metabolite transporter (DMT)-like permease
LQETHHDLYGVALATARPTNASLVTAALLTAVVCISFAASLFKLADPTHPLIKAMIRLAIAAVCLSPLVVRGWRRGSLTRRVLNHAIMAGIAYGVHFGAWVWSLNLTSVAASVTLVTTTPILLALLSLFSRRDRPDRQLWLALATGVIGVTFIGGYDGLLAPGALVGDGLALLGAVAIAAYFLLSRRLGEEMDLWAYSGIATAIGAITLGITATFMGIPLLVSGTEAFSYLVLAALIPQLIGHSLLTWALRHATPTQVAMVVVGEPAGATIIAWIWLGDVVSIWLALGCAITLTAVVIASIRPGRSKATNPPETSEA